MPPANILFDHIDRVSHKLERIKSSFKMDDVKSIAASSKGSFRKPEESAVADGGSVGADGAEVLMIRMLRVRLPGF